MLDRVVEELAVLRLVLDTPVPRVPKLLLPRQAWKAAITRAAANPYSTLLWAARSTVAWAELVDGTREQQFDAVARFCRFVDPNAFERQFVGAVCERDRIFDKGHTPVVDCIREGRVQVASYVDARALDRSTEPGSTIELDSKASSHVQAADIAAGLARRWYRDEGREAVRWRFRCVWLNGVRV